MDPVTPATVAVEVKPAIESKINWTQIVSAIAMIVSWLSGGKIGLSADQQAGLAVIIGLLSNVVTFILKTWFTKTITPSSVGQATVSAVSTSAVKIT